MIHLEGMGVMGCMIAAGLRGCGQKFTWSDTDEERTSWKVSTGAILPFGDDDSEFCIGEWRRMLDRHEWRDVHNVMQQAVFCYVSENPPHNGKKFGTEPTVTVGPVKVSNRFSYHMDVQTFVEQMRSRMRNRRTDGPEKRDVVVVTHGFGENIYKWSWGWSAVVGAEFDDRIAAECDDGDVPMLYGRRGYQLPYLYPMGPTGLYYAGTTLITQNEPKSLEITPKFETWAAHIHEYTDGLVEVTDPMEGSLMEGWRPMPYPEAPLLDTSKRRTIQVRPQYGNGIRLFPLTWAAVVLELFG